MLVIAHRGVSSEQHENTLSAFAKALDYKCTMVECDVHCCASGEPVVHHDENINHPPFPGKPISRLTLSQLKTVSLPQGQSIPTFNELLTLLRGQTNINIELKGRATAAPISRLIQIQLWRGAWRPEQFLISSFAPRELLRSKQLLPDIRHALISINWPILIRLYKRAMPLYSLHMDAHHFRPRHISRAHRLGLKLYCYTVNDPDHAAGLKGHGVDGIFSDMPHMIRHTTLE